MSAPEASVIVPTRNRASLVRDHLPTLAEQQLEAPFEVIVADNGSTDDTPAIVREASARWPHVRLLEVPEPGAARARHAGARAGRAPILVFIDDDMRAEPNVLREHLRLQRETPGACVLGNVASVPSRHPFERMLAYIYDGPRSTLAERAPTFEDIWPGHMSLPRDLYFRLGGFTARFADLGSLAGGEGLDFGLKVVQGGISVVFAPEAVTHHRFTARFASALDRGYVNGLAYARLLDEHPGLRISGIEPAPSTRRARVVEFLCRALATVMEPFASGTGPPPAPLALVYSLGLRAATGRGVSEGQRQVRSATPG